jgi:DNA polymerase IV
MQRTILHVDMDAFFTSVEQLDHPEYAGKPVVVGAPADKRGVVAAASYEARKFGIHSAMPSREAARRCPDAVFLPVKMDRYLEVSERVFAAFEAFTPNIEPLSVDEAFLDLTGAQRLFGSGPKAAVAIKQAVKAATGLNASIGVASNKFLAKLASDMDKPDGLTVVPSDPDAIKAFLAPLSVGRIWGVGRVTLRLLEKNGFHKIADIQKLPPERLAAIIGMDFAAHLAALAIGEDSRELVMDRQRKSYSREHTFDEDCTSQEELERVLCSLIEDVGSQLRADRKYVKTIQIKLRWKNFQTITRQRQLPAAVCDNTTLRECAMELFLEQKLQGPVRLIGFGTSNIADRPDSYQIGLFENRSQSLKTRERLSHVIDQIRSRFGASSISSARALDCPDDV